MVLHWKEYKGIKYAYSQKGFFWVIYPSGLKGQYQGEESDEGKLKSAIDRLKISK
jgi:hypothetical protein